MAGRDARLLRLLGLAQRDLGAVEKEVREGESVDIDRPKELDEIARRVEALEKRVDVIEARSP